jgi:hypothetical protein
LTVLLIGESKLVPLTVKVTSTPVDDDVGVITTDAVDAVVGVAPEIAQEYVGAVTFVSKALNVAFVGVKAPPAFWTKAV